MVPSVKDRFSLPLSGASELMILVVATLVMLYGPKILAVITVLANFAADLVYAWLDPRIRYA